MFVPVYLSEQVSGLMLVAVKWKVSIRFHYSVPAPQVHLQTRSVTAAVNMLSQARVPPLSSKVI